MSYILDALKRADTERERGAAPGLHTRHQLPAGNAGGASARRLAWVTAAAGLTLVVLASAFGVWRTPEAPPMADMQSAASPMPNSPEPTAPAAPAAPVAPSTPSTPPVAIAPVPIVVAEVPVAKARPTEKSSQKPTTAPALTSVRPASTPLLSDLPTELRSQVPKITITGSVYSDSPAQRLLLVNNLVLSQGSQITADLKLEEIQPRSSMFSFKGTHFRVMH